MVLSAACEADRDHFTSTVSGICVAYVLSSDYPMCVPQARGGSRVVVMISLRNHTLVTHNYIKGRRPRTISSLLRCELLCSINGGPREQVRSIGGGGRADSDSWCAGRKFLK